MTEKIGDSRFWVPLWAAYAGAPSMALCRVPELEYASRLAVKDRKVLDHCCGDGLIASLAWPDSTLAAGCDLNEAVIAIARDRGIYNRLDVCDVSERLPYEDDFFDIVFNNSGLEHVYDLEATLREISRVLAPGGSLAFNILNHRFFEWWPLGEQAKEGYRGWQPVYHVLTIEEWRNCLAKVGLRVTSAEGYFGYEAAQTLAKLDHDFSAVALTQCKIPFVSLYRRFPRLFKAYWRRRIERLAWYAGSDEGAGYFIQAEKINA